jgi:hypothetical protein
MSKWKSMDSAPKDLAVLVATDGYDRPIAARYPFSEAAYAWRTMPKMPKKESIKPTVKVPEGYVLMPKEPTPQMLDLIYHEGALSRIYKLLLAAAPKPEGGLS